MKELEKGSQFIQAGNYSAAEESMRALLEVAPENIEARYVLAAALMQQARYAEALAEITRIRECEPEHAGAAMVEIYVYQKQDKVATEIRLLETFIQRLRKWLPRDSERYGRFLSESWSLLGSAYTLLGKPEKAVEAFLHSSRLEPNQIQKVREYSNALFAANYAAELPIQQLDRLARGYQALLADCEPYEHFVEAKAKLRIGFISPDLRRHPVAFFLYPLLHNLSQAQYEVFAYAANAEDAVSSLLREQCTAWCNISGFSAQQAAAQVYADEIDILVDLSGHTKNNCLPVLAFRPAPVQICGIGYFNTTGLKAVDYFLSDVYCDPPGQPATGFSERLLRLPHSHFCYMPLQAMPLPGALPCRKNGYVTFGCFNNFSKVTDEVLAAWQEILCRVPTAHLLLKSRILGSDEGQAVVRQRLKQAGMPLERVTLQGFSEDYLEKYQDVDIALDTFPYTGGATTCEALYMGVPVVTLAGSRHGARFGYSLLMNAGLGELVAQAPAEYVERAAAMAADSELLSVLRQNLRSMLEGSVLMNGRQYAEDMEQAFQAVWLQRLRAQSAERLSARQLHQLRRRLWQLVQQKEYRQVMAMARRGLLAVPDSQELLEIYAAAALEMGAATIAKVPVGRLRELFPKDGYASFLAARLAFLQGDWAESAGIVRQVLTSGADLTAEVKVRLYNLLGQSQKEMGAVEDVPALYLQAVHFAPDTAAKAVEYANYLFNLHYRSGITQLALRQAHEYYAGFFSSVRPFVHTRRQRHDRLRIGYLSPDFRLHVVVFFSYAFFRAYDRSHFEVFCYQRGVEDAISQQIKGQVDGWCNVSHMGSQEIAEKIHSDEIDILFDLAGHTRNSGLPVLAWKPAPIQLSGIGYFDTTGLPAVDYFLTDVYADPVGSNDGYFTERLVRLPYSHFCYTAADVMPECLPAPCARNGWVTFGSFNNFAKVSDEMLVLWGKILSRVPAAKLLLKCSAFGNAEACRMARQRLMAAGISQDRVELRAASFDYLPEYGEIDVALDTYPYPGGGTTCDALYMGVPVVTLAGERHGSRFGYSLLCNIGLKEECCAQSPAEYVEKAVRLAKDQRKLQQLHAGLRSQMQASPLMDGRLYMQGVEKAYAQMWRVFMAGQPAAAILVDKEEGNGQHG